MPAMAPEKMFEAAAIVSVLAPSATVPACPVAVSDSVCTVVPPLVRPAMEKVPPVASATLLESATELVPVSASVPPLIVVAPV